MFNFLKKDKSLYKLTLHHNNGMTEIELENISNYNKITKYLGKDKIIEHQNMVINLKNYHTIELEKS